MRATRPATESEPQTKANASARRQLRKDQERALTAYSWAEAAKLGAKLEEYETAVQSFAAALLRSGLAAAVAVLERSKEREGFKLLLNNLASRPLPGISP